MTALADHEHEQAGFWRAASERQAAQGNPAIALMFKNEAFFIENDKAIAGSILDAKV
jgi:hypothetical protein